MIADGQGLSPDRFERACAECGSHRECMCRCRARIKAVAKEIDAMAKVVDEARIVIGETVATGLARAIEAYDAAVLARERCE